MHKLAKGLKKKKKQKKGKKGAEEDEFDPEELERYRRERAEAQQKAEDSGEQASNASSDEWKKFEALTAGVDSILKKTQGDLDRIKSTSFFQRKPPLDEERKKEGQEGEEADKDQEDHPPGKKKSSSSKKWVGFDEEGNPIEGEPPDFGAKKEERPLVNEDGFVDVPDDDEDGREDSADEDIFDTAYVDVLQNIDVQLAYIPDSPVEEEAGDDPFDTTNADKVLKTVDKKGNKLVSLGNAVEVLSGRIDYVSSCKISKGRRPRLQQDLLLDDFDEDVARAAAVDAGEPLVAEPVQAERTLLDDDNDLPPVDVPIDLAKLPPTVLPSPAVGEGKSEAALDISEFEVLKEKTILEEIPDLDDAEFELNGCAAPDEQPPRLEEAEDPFGAKEPEIVSYQSEIIEASFEAATFVDEEDPFDTTFADNILPGKTELKFIERELDELPVSEVTISLTDPAGLNRDYETGLLKEVGSDRRDLLGGSATDLTQLADEPIAPLEDISSYVDPFDTSSVKEIPPGKTELKFLEKELLGERREESPLDDEDFDPRREEERQLPFGTVDFRGEGAQEERREEEEGRGEEVGIVDRRSSRPEVLELGVPRAVAFELPTPSKRPDLLATTEEEKALPSKPLTPYYTQKSIEDYLPGEEEQEGEAADVDPFDTSFVAKVAPGKTELKLIESELLRQQDHPTRLPHSLSDHEFDPRAEGGAVRRQSDFTIRPNDLRLNELQSSVLKKFEEVNKRGGGLAEKRQESLLDERIEVDAKPLTPRIETRRTIEEDEEISYQDPFDTSIATNILPGKAELKILETELEQIPAEIPVARPVPIALTAVINATVVPEVDPDFDPRAEERKDFLCIDDPQDPGAKVLTPLQNESFPPGEDVDPFDTSFASLGPGKTELKLLESELMEK